MFGTVEHKKENIRLINASFAILLRQLINYLYIYCSSEDCLMSNSCETYRVFATLSCRCDPEDYLPEMQKEYNPRYVSSWMEEMRHQMTWSGSNKYKSTLVQQR
jgi:hypothetical protein